MKIDLSHATVFDYITKLYDPIKTSHLMANNTFIFPHEKSLKPDDTREVIRTNDLVIGKVSFPSTSQGIELGWANIWQIPIVCIYQSGKNFSSSLKIITNKFISYNNNKNLVKVIEKLVYLDP